MKDEGDKEKKKSLSNATLARRPDTTAAVLCRARPVRKNALARDAET